MKKIIYLLFLVFFTISCTTKISIPTVIPQQPNTVFGKPSKSFSFMQVVSSIKRSEQVISYPSINFNIDSGLGYCNNFYGSAQNDNWGAFTRKIGNWGYDLNEEFVDVMKSLGYKVKGSKNRLFADNTSYSSSQYFIGANILDMKGNICDLKSSISSELLNKQAGEIYLKIKWVIYSTLDKQEVYSLETQGVAKESEPKFGGLAEIFTEAFAVNVEALAADDVFYKLMTDEDFQKKKEILAKEGIIKDGRNMDFKPKKKKTIGFKSPRLNSNNIKDTEKSLVIVRVGGGHGSGVVVSKKGLIITNEHVVGDAQKVKVVFNNDMEAVGEVLRYSKIRDVALIKVDNIDVVPIPLETNIKKLNIGQDVYAMGAPLKEEMKSSLTKGIISSFRVHEIDKKYSYIQSDAFVTNGNSGGALLDKKGNLIGVSVSGFKQEGSPTGVNFFIPVGEALKALKMQKREMEM